MVNPNLPSLLKHTNTHTHTHTHFTSAPSSKTRLGKSGEAQFHSYNTHTHTHTNTTVAYDRRPNQGNSSFGSFWASLMAYEALSATELQPAGKTYHFYFSSITCDSNGQSKFAVTAETHKHTHTHTHTQSSLSNRILQWREWSSY